MRLRPGCIRDRALTLVEVVAALALLAVTVCSLLLAQSKALRQAADAGEREEATVLAGELIAQWRIDGENLSVDAEGVSESDETWRWKRTGTTWQSPDQKNLLSVQLDLERHRETEPARTVASYMWIERIEPKE